MTSSNPGGPRPVIVLPARGEGDWVRLTVDALLARTDYGPFDIVIVTAGDDASGVRFVASAPYDGRVRVKHQPSSGGWGRALNEALSEADASYHVFLDAHSFPEREDWLGRLVSCAESHPDAAWVQPLVVDFACADRVDAGATPDVLRLPRGETFCSQRWAWPYDYWSAIATPERFPLQDTSYEAMAGTAHAALVPSALFRRLGGFDPEVGGWADSAMDYSVRAWLLGHPTVVEPSVSILHRSKPAIVRAARDSVHVVHSVLRTTYKYLSPRRRDVAERLFRAHGLSADVDRALQWIRDGDWLAERAEHFRARVRDDDWLFERFAVEEEHFGLRAL